MVLSGGNLGGSEVNWPAECAARGLSPDTEMLDFVTADEILTYRVIASDMAIFAGARSAPVDVRPLEEHKQVVRDRIDAESERRIYEGPGFEFPPSSGQFFSLSQNAQSKWNGLAVRAALVLMGATGWETVNVRTKDDQVNLTIDSAPMLLGMWEIGGNVVMATLGAGNVAKGQVNAATSIADVDAIAAAYFGS